MYIAKNQLLLYRNVLSFKTRINCESIAGMVQHVRMNTDALGLTVCGEILVTISSGRSMSEGNALDMEFLLPVDKPFPDTPYFTYKPVLRLNNCLKLRHDGSLNDAWKSTGRLSRYITDNGYTPVTGFYYSLVRTCEEQEINNITDIYVSVCSSVSGIQKTEKRSRILCSSQSQTSLRY